MTIIAIARVSSIAISAITWEFWGAGATVAYWFKCVPVDFFLVVTVVFTDVREDAVPIIVETHSEYPMMV